MQASELLLQIFEDSIDMLREQNRKLHAEKSNSLKMAHPNMDVRELEQKREMLHKDVLELLQQKTTLQFMCMQLHHIMGNGQLI